MATRAKAKQTQQNGGEERGQTRRVVLQRMPVVVIPPELKGVPIDDALFKQFVSLFESPAEAWVERGEFTGTKVHAIEQYAGKPGSPDAKVGEFKAVPARGWQGGARYTAPPAPKVEREVIR